jgi:hypothetical protein
LYRGARRTIPNEAGGQGVKANLTTCWQRGANIGQRGYDSYNMRKPETLAADAMGEGRAVLYNVVVNYKSSESTIPTSWSISMLGTYLNGDPGVAWAGPPVDNAAYTPNGKYVNLGN